MIDVVCGVLREGERVLLVRRVPGGAHGGLWELPGGKVEPDEAPEAALARELAEELAIAVEVGDWLGVEADERIRLHAYAIARWRGAIALCAHDALCWADRHVVTLLPLPRADARLLAVLGSRIFGS